MGNSPDSKSFHTSLDFFEKNYIKVAKKTDPCYGEGIIFQDKHVDIEVFLKEEFFFDSTLYKRKLNFLKSEYERPHASMVGIIGFASSSEEQFCSKHFKCYVVFEYLTTSLVQDIKERRDNEFFLSEQEIWKRIETLVYGFSFLQEKGVSHGKINMRNILIGEGGLKILNTSLLNSCNAYAKLLTQTNDKSEELFLSPKLMQALKENEWQPNHDPFKSDVFCLGVTFLEMITLKNSNKIFEFEKHLIFDDEIISRINEIKDRYSIGLGNFIQNMLYINEEKRKNFIELRLLLEKRHIEEDLSQKNGKMNNVTLIESKVKDFLVTPSKSISTNYESTNLGSTLSRIKERDFHSQKSLSHDLNNSNNEGMNTGMLIKSRIKRCSSPKAYQKTLSFFNSGAKVMEYIEEKEKEFAEIKIVTAKQKKKFPEEDALLSLQNIKSKDINVEKHGDSVNSSIKKNWKDVEQNFQPVISIRESSMVSLDFELTRPLELKSNYNMYEIVVERYEDNSFYEGEKIDDEKMGKGRFTYSDGSFYDGEWNHNKKNGVGALIYKNKSPIYIGSWKNDRFDGKGVLFNIYNRNEGVVDWVKFEGDFEEGRKKGSGFLFLNDGERREENN